MLPALEAASMVQKGKKRVHGARNKCKLIFVINFLECPFKSLACFSSPLNETIWRRHKPRRLLVLFFSKGTAEGSPPRRSGRRGKIECSGNDDKRGIRPCRERPLYPTEGPRGSWAFWLPTDLWGRAGRTTNWVNVNANLSFALVAQNIWQLTPSLSAERECLSPRWEPVQKLVLGIPGDFVADSFEITFDAIFVPVKNLKKYGKTNYPPSMS